MCDVINIRLKRRIATRSKRRNQPLNIKTAVELPIFMLRLPNFLLLVASLLFRRIFMTSQMTLSSASNIGGCIMDILARLKHRDASLISLYLIVL